MAEEGAVEEGAHDVGGEVGSGQRALGGVDQVEGVEVADVGQNGHNAHRGQDQWKFDAPEDGPPAGAVDVCGFDPVPREC